MSRAVRRDRTSIRGYRPVHADCRARRRRRARPQARKITCDPVLSARMLADLKRSRTTVLAAGRRQDDHAGRTRPGTRGPASAA